MNQAKSRDLHDQKISTFWNFRQNRQHSIGIKMEYFRNEFMKWHNSQQLTSDGEEENGEEYEHKKMFNNGDVTEVLNKDLKKRRNVTRR